jgi:hypothetical protein
VSGQFPGTIGFDLTYGPKKAAAATPAAKK